MTVVQLVTALVMSQALLARLPMTRLGGTQIAARVPVFRTALMNLV